jgi:hypothetical protein
MSLPQAALYLAAHHIAERSAAIRPHLAELLSEMVPSGIARATLHVAPAGDSLIVELCLIQVTPQLMARVSSCAQRTGLLFVDPARLAPMDRTKFLMAMTTRYKKLLVDPGAPTAALDQVLRAPLKRAAGTISPEDPEALLVARYRRGEGWQVGRVRSLVGTELTLTTGTPPPVGVFVDVVIGGGESKVSAHAAVVASATTDMALGADPPGFTVRLVVTDERQAAAIDRFSLSLRQQAQRLLAPPPPRREVRYPVCWPVLLRTSDGAESSASALDMSLHGMFVTASRPIESAPSPGVEVDLPIDDGGRSLRARSRVARSLAPAIAQARGLTPGVGLELATLGPRDSQRFGRFVQRIGRRSTAHILVAATLERASPILAELVAAGYGASHAASPSELCARLGAGVRPPELVLIDISLSRADRGVDNAIERLLAQRGLMHSRISEEAPGEVRALADLSLLT